MLAHYIRVHLDWSRARRMAVGTVSMLVGAALTIYSFYVQAVPGIIHTTPVLEIGWAFCTINCVLLTAGTFLMFTCINAELRNVSDAHLLARVMGDRIQGVSRSSYGCRDTGNRDKHICQLLCDY